MLVFSSLKRKFQAWREARSQRSYTGRFGTITLTFFEPTADDYSAFCQAAGFTDLEICAGRAWAYPPHSVMKVPLPKMPPNVVVNWNGNPWEPFRANVEVRLAELAQAKFEAHVKEQAVMVYRTSSIFCQAEYYVRTAEYPLAWLYWWFYFRFEETLTQAKYYVVTVACVWGLAETPVGAYPSWIDIYAIGWFRKCLNAAKLWIVKGLNI